MGICRKSRTDLILRMEKRVQTGDAELSSGQEGCLTLSKNYKSEYCSLNNTARPDFEHLQRTKLFHCQPGVGPCEGLLVVINEKIDE